MLQCSKLLFPSYIVLQDVERHLQEEEHELLPSLQKELSQEQLMQLGRAFEWVKLMAPSR